MINIQDKSAPKSAVSQQDIQNWLVEYLAELLEVEANTVDSTASFDRHGIDSASAVALMSDLEEWLGAELEPTLMYDYPTIETLSEQLSVSLRDQ